MNYLVDANVLSEATKLAPHPQVIDWLTANEDNFVVDPIVLGELWMGILPLPSGQRRRRLEQWFTVLTEKTLCLAWDANVGIRWARLIIELRKKGQALPILDSMIAATALTHDLTVATRNVRDFKKAGVKTFDPFA